MIRERKIQSTLAKQHATTQVKSAISLIVLVSEVVNYAQTIVIAIFIVLMYLKAVIVKMGVVSSAGV